MPGKKTTGKTSALRARVERALEDRQWGGLDLGDILDKARDDEVDILKPFVPAILAHHDWTVRADALVLYYVETRDRGALNELRRILMRKRCYSGHRYCALNTFDAYVDVGHYPEIIELFEAVQGVLPEAPRAYGLDKHIPNMLAKWKRFAGKGR